MRSAPCDRWGRSSRSRQVDRDGALAELVLLVVVRVAPESAPRRGFVEAWAGRVWDPFQELEELEEAESSHGGVDFVTLRWPFGPFGLFVHLALGAVEVRGPDRGARVCGAWSATVFPSSQGVSSSTRLI